MNEQALAAEIELWDGKTAVYLTNLYAKYSHETDFGAGLVRLMAERPLQVGASWLLKKHLEERGALTERLLAELFALLPTFNHWETQLHLLQSLDYLPIPSASAAQVEAFVRDCLTSKRTFVRAWAYSGFYRLAQQHPVYEAEAMQLLDRAMSDEAASVRARIRQLWKS